MLLLVCILIYGVVFLHFKTLFINYTEFGCLPLLPLSDLHKSPVPGTEHQ